MTAHRAHMRCADGLVHDVRVWHTPAAACGVIVFDPPSDVPIQNVNMTLTAWGFRVVRPAYRADGTGPTTTEPIDCMSCLVAQRTPYAVLCNDHGQQFLTTEQYNYQMGRPGAPWRCPRCGESAQWDDDEYEGESDADEDDRQAT